MSTIIKSEEPIDHWGFLDIKGKTILDLGCGKFSSTISTADWFLLNGASKVIGVDMGSNEYLDAVHYIQMCIDSKEKLQNLIRDFEPQIIKADIEGAEIHFKELSSLGNTIELAVEYHSSELKETMLEVVERHGFTIQNIYQLNDIDLGRMGVIHAKK
jgi:predicted RNA methylase